MNHTTPKNLNPAAALAETASLTAAFEAGNVYLCTRLCEREVMGTEFRLCVLSEQLFCKLLQGSLQVRKGDVFVDNQTLNLMEGR